LKLHRENRGGKGERTIYVMHGEKAQNRWRNEVIMEEKMRVLEGPGKIDQFCKKKWRLTEEQKRRPHRLLLLLCLL